MTITCPTCCIACPSISKYFSHQWVHRYTPNIAFPCPFPNCGKVLAQYKKLCDHKRSHARPVPPSFSTCGTDDGPGFIRCSSAGCVFKAPSTLKLLNHLDTHVRNGQVVTCICGQTFKVSSSLRSHFRRKHSNSTSFEVTYLDSCNNTSVQSTDLPDVDMEVDVDGIADVANEFLNSDSNLDAESSSTVSNDDFLKSFALMLLRLQSKAFLSATTLQFVAEAIRDIGDHAVEHQSQVFKKLSDKYNIEPHVRDAIEEEIFNKPVHDLAVGDRGALRSEHMRKKYYKENFDLLEPVEYVLSNGVEEHKYHYIPIKQSFANLLKDKSVQKLYNKKEQSRDNILKDFEDGLAFKKNKFFIENPCGIKVILYIDAFEPCDALKAARGKHKILAVYAALGNMPAYCRSIRDPIQLVMLVKDSTIKDFNYEEVFAPLLEDLKSLHDEGIEVTFEEVPQILKGCLVAICSDNLEAHTIGGFNQNFSWADFYCRFCYARRAGRVRGDVTPCHERTCLNYDKDAELADKEEKSIKGVWEASVFNKLSDYHCIEGLPSCIAHDVPEGILPKDLFLALKILVKKKWFSWGYINAKIKLINKGSSVNIRKIEKKNKKIIGSASSNLRLLQIITLALFEKVKDPNDLCWQMIVTLQEFMALVGAPKLSVDQTFHIDVLGEKYISLRKQVLPNVSLKCKHHYILHYGFLTRLHGPLQRWSTIRYESKHQYFKQASRSTHNFINPTLSLSKRHQYLQAYLREGNIFPTVVEAASVIPLKQDLYSPEVLRALEASGAMSSQLFTTTSAKYHGILYSVGEVLMIRSNDDRTIDCLLVDIIVVGKKFTELIFIGSAKLIKYHQYFGVYEVVDSNKGLISCRADQLASPDPLLPINIGEQCFTYLKHSIMVDSDSKLKKKENKHL